MLVPSPRWLTLLSPSSPRSTAADARVGGALWGQFGLCRGFPLPGEQGDRGPRQQEGRARGQPPACLPPSASLLPFHVHRDAVLSTPLSGTRVSRDRGPRLTDYPGPRSADEARGSEAEARLSRSLARAGGEETPPGRGVEGGEGGSRDAPFCLVGKPT